MAGLTSCSLPRYRYRLRGFDFFVVGAMVGCCFLVAECKRLNPRALRWFEGDRTAALGSEYDNVAIAILKGKGFANPFGVDSGPTAWVAPVLPAVLAGLYRLTPDREIVVWIVRVLTLVSVYFSALIVASWARKLGQPAFGIVAIVAVLIPHFHDLFQRADDTWLCLLAMNAVLMGLCSRLCYGFTYSRAISWGLVGGGSLLISPVIGLVWLCSSVYLWVSYGSRKGCELQKQQLYRGGVCLLVASIIVSPWVIRNLIQFKRVIPVKSNLAFELWQSQCITGDGVLDLNTLGVHPWSTNSKSRRRYVELGEVAFLQEKWSRFEESIRAEPIEYGKKVAWRFVAASFYWSPLDVRSERWTTVVSIKRVLFALPMLGLLTLLTKRLSGLRHVEISIILVYLSFIAPYAAVSYYDRYGAQLVAVKG